MKIKEVTEYIIKDFTGQVCIFLEQQKAYDFVKSGGFFKGKPVFRIVERKIKVKYN